MGLFDAFANPPREYRQAPFWFWNHRLDKDILGWQIEQMDEKGLGGFVMHARHGLITPYLSEAWFDCIRFCCERAAELGMTSWAYDERDWPSGPAGGTVIADKANRLSYLRFDVRDIEGPQQISLGPDVVSAYGARPGEPLQRLDRNICDVPAGPWRLATALRFECPAILWFESYLDTLDPAACAAFIRSTYGRHVQELGDLKDLGLAGFFTDEPALSTYPDDLSRIPWTTGLPAAFQLRKGYDLLDQLPDFFAGDPAGAQIRYDYWDVATSLFEESFFKQVATWCETHGLKMIGHPLGEEPLFFQFRCLGNIFNHMKHFHMPGMDHLGLRIGKGSPLAMTPKMVASAALLAGRSRTMTETFGESGWGLSLRDMKWMADWQIVNGINYLIPHAFYYSVSGRRKKDSPPSEFIQAPFWPYYRQFADYTARLTAALTPADGEVAQSHGAKIALLYPMSSIWADFVPGKEASPSIVEMERQFAPLGEALLAAHRDFVVVDEASFAGAQVGEKTFSVNGLTFEALVIPPLTSLREETLDVVRRVAASCVVTAAPGGPVRVLKGRGPALGDSVDLAAIPGIRILAGLRPKDVGEALASVVPEVIIESVSKSAISQDIYYLRRRKDGKVLYFFANTSDKPVAATLSLEDIGYAEIWNPETGKSSAAPGQRVENSRLTLPFAFPVKGSCLVVVDPAQPVAMCPISEFRAGTRISLCSEGSYLDLWRFSPNNGSLYALRNWELRMENRGHFTELRYATQFMMPENLGNMRLILDEVPTWPQNVPEAARPLVAHETRAEVLLDGEPLKDELPWEIDPQFRVLDMRGRCEPGTHQIEIVIKNSGWFPQPPLGEYVWLAGDFRLDPGGASPGLSGFDGSSSSLGPSSVDGTPCLIPIRGVKTGPWEGQGHPFFSGTASYYSDIELPPEVEGRRVFLDAGRVGDVLDLEVNTRSAGVRAWPPYRIEVTGLVHRGWNQFVLKVTNSARNLFEGPDPNCPSGLLDEVWLEIEQ